MELNVGSILRDRSVMMGEKVGFVHGDREISFKEMNDRANVFAGWLQEIGVQKGETIAILCKNNEQAIAVLFGAAKIGVISVMVNWRLGKEELLYILTHSESKLIVCDEVFYPIVEELEEEIPATHVLSGNTSPSFEELWSRSMCRQGKIRLR